MIRIDKRLNKWAKDSWVRKHLKAAGMLAIRQGEECGQVYRIEGKEVFACYRKNGIAYVEAFPLIPGKPLMLPGPLSIPDTFLKKEK